MEPETRERLKTLSIASGFSMSAVVRRLVDGAEIREMPPADYHAMIGELRAIGNNLNQIAYIANATGRVDREAYLQEAARLREGILRIRQAVELR